MESQQPGANNNNNNNNNFFNDLGNVGYSRLNINRRLTRIHSQIQIKERQLRQIDLRLRRLARERRNVQDEVNRLREEDAYLQNALEGADDNEL